MLTQQQLDEQIKQANDYLCKQGTRGFEFWCHSKGFDKKDEEYIRDILGYEKVLTHNPTKKLEIK